MIDLGEKFMKKFILLVFIVLFSIFSYGKSWKYLGVQGQWGPFANSTYMDINGWLDTPYVIFCDNSSMLRVYKYYNNNWHQVGNDLESGVIPYIEVYGANVYVAYFDTVYVRKNYRYNGISWIPLLSVPYDSVGEIKLLNGIPLSYSINYSEGGRIYKYDGLTWNSLDGSFTNSSVSYCSFFTKENNVYALYKDLSLSENVVKKWDGISWNSYGGIGVFGSFREKDAIVVTPNGDIYVLVWDIYNMIVKKYSVSTLSWNTVGLFFSGSRGYLATSNGNVYLLFWDPSTRRLTVYKYSGSGLVWDVVGVSDFPGVQIWPTYNAMYVYNDNIYVIFKELGTNVVSVMGYTEDFTPTITPTITLTSTMTITPTITPTPVIVNYRTTLSTWIEGSVNMDSPTGITRISIADRQTWFVDKNGYSVFACRDRVQPNTYLWVIKNDYDIEFQIVDRTNLLPIDCSGNTCLIHFTVFKEP